MPLLILGMALLFSIRMFSIGENEALALKSGALPFSDDSCAISIRHGFRRLRETSALYALWLHVWLFLSAGALVLLRVPPALFFVGGVWLLSRAARLWGGELSANGLLWVAAFWPYAFHYGTQATQYSFSFLLIAALILAYMQFCESPRLASWAVVGFLSLLLTYVSYFGWAIVILLGIDYWLRNRNRPPSASVFGCWARSRGSRDCLYSTLACNALRELWARRASCIPPRECLLLNAGYNLYALVASESVAPWFWRFGVPVTLAIAIALVLCWFCPCAGKRGDFSSAVDFSS